MSVFKRWNGTQWETIGPGISSARFENINNMIAPEFDPKNTYDIGDYVVQSDKLYRCINRIGTPQAWNSENWREVKLGQDVTELRNDVVTVSNTQPTSENNRIWVKPDNNDMKIPLVEDVMMLPNPNDYGENDQIPRSTGTGIEWTDYGLPSDQQTENAINAWLDAHPEATTTVQDGSLTYQKLVNGTLGFVTPEMFGAIGDGIADDTLAIQNALAFGKKVCFEKKVYKCGPVLLENKNGVVISGQGAKLIFPDNTNNKKWFSFINCANVAINDIYFDGNRENQIIKRMSDGVAGKDVTENCPVILLDHVDRAILQSCTFYNCQADGIQIDKIYYDQVATENNISLNITIDSCLFDKCGRNGISVVHCDGCVISNNQFKNMKIYSTSIACGVDVEPNPVSGFAARNVIIANNVCTNCVFGIVISSLAGANAYRLQITNNTIGSAKYGIYCSVNNGSEIHINGNSIDDSVFGVFGSYLHNINIENNKFSNLKLNPRDTVGGGIGIYCHNTVLNSTIKGNSISSPGVYSLYIMEATNVTITNNIIDGNIESTDKYHILINTAADSNVSENIFYGNKYPVIINNSNRVKSISNKLFGTPVGNVSLRNPIDSLAYGNIIRKVNVSNNYTLQVKDTLEYTGISVEIPANSTYILSFYGSYTASPPTKSTVTRSATASEGRALLGATDGGGFCNISGYANSSFTVYFWCAWSAIGTNKVGVDGVIIT